ncbi:tRNA (guanine-N(7)-)-methyltransferase [Striga asiatica]|uniref:tRNA (Guanine-N(7)-)-methyltransferase n=1 Tax=Striga asiatica TaxID=4170 RepID=A0A5A7PCR0_STRAF|nr:tRNA (guanine-N(7)-)-methyltransferase [Striga asiatica]
MPTLPLPRRRHHLRRSLHPTLSHAGISMNLVADCTIAAGITTRFVVRSHYLAVVSSSCSRSLMVAGAGRKAVNDDDVSEMVSLESGSDAVKMSRFTMVDGNSDGVESRCQGGGVRR